MLMSLSFLLPQKLKLFFRIFVTAILTDIIREHCSKLNLLQLSHSMFCKNVARLAVARGCHTWIRSLATAKRAIFLQNILWESCCKFDFKQCSLKKFLKMLIFLQEYYLAKKYIGEMGFSLFIHRYIHKTLYKHDWYLV